MGNFQFPAEETKALNPEPEPVPKTMTKAKSASTTVPESTNASTPIVILDQEASAVTNDQKEETKSALIEDVN